MKVLDDGSIVDNPDAKMAITDSTRNMIRETIANGLEQNLRPFHNCRQRRHGWRFR